MRVRGDELKTSFSTQDAKVFSCTFSLVYSNAAEKTTIHVLLLRRVHLVHTIAQPTFDVITFVFISTSAAFGLTDDDWVYPCPATAAAACGLAHDRETADIARTSEEAKDGTDLELVLFIAILDMRSTVVGRHLLTIVVPHS